MVSAGYYFSCWVINSGAAFCSGQNDYGQLGNGMPKIESERGWEYMGSDVPTPVAGGLTFSTVSVGKNHACGVTTGNTAYCWGDNRFYQLGNDMIRESPVPVLVAGGLSFRTVTAGNAHTCAVETSGAAYCWGNGDEGQLGNGTRISSAVPVAVVGGLSFTFLTTNIMENSESYTCGLATSGVAYCWGTGSDGELGNGTTTVKQGSWSIKNVLTAPTSVAVGVTFTALSAGGLHVCGISTSGTAYCWGNGSWGQLGTGSKRGSLTPVIVSGGLKFASISSGSLHTCGITASGAVYCWGSSGGDRTEVTWAESLSPALIRQP
jgi:alpha-tubulin suppressor-like RCC1 family protein